MNEKNELENELEKEIKEIKSFMNTLGFGLKEDFWKGFVYEEKNRQKKQN